MLEFAEIIFLIVAVFFYPTRKSFSLKISEFISSNIIDTE